MAAGCMLPAAEFWEAFGSPVGAAIQPSGWCGPVASLRRVSRRVRGGSEPFVSELYVRSGFMKQGIK